MADAWQQPNLTALAEDDGHGDSCGPIIMLDYLHVLNGHPLNYAETTALRARLIGDGLMASNGTGMTMGNIVTAMERYYGIKSLHYVPWSVSTMTLNALKADLLKAWDAHQLVGMETHNAQALPGNQPGIQNHFLLGGGYKLVNGVLWVLCCNGDSLKALAGGKTNPEQPPTWYSWDNLVAAQISSYAVWPSVEAHMLELSQVAGIFKENPDGSWQQGGHVLKGGMLDFYRSFPWGGLQGYTAFGLLKTSETAIGTPASGKTAQPTLQIFERAALVYDPDRKIDNPPGAVGSIYLWHIDKPQVLAIIAPLPTPVPPAAPEVTFGAPTVVQALPAAGDVTLTVNVPYSVK